MKKVYYVFPDYNDWDDFDGIVVVAENEERALEIVNTSYYNSSYFKAHQGEIHIEEVDVTTEHIVLTSFRAG